MNGQEILEHFAERLASLEARAALPTAEDILRLPSPPLDLRSLTSSYQGTPALFPASWVPTFSHLSTTLTRLLRGIVQVEVFRLQYKQCDDCCNVIGSPNKEVVFSEKSSKFSTSDLLRGQVLEPFQHKGKTAPCHGYRIHPIPTSSMSVMDFEAFASESSSLLSDHKNQILYLSWRSLPEASSPSFMPEEFCHFIGNIIYPATTPNFIASDMIKQRNLWMGCLVTSRIHFDALDNLHVCLSGAKVVHLYPPSELPNLYPETWNKDSLNNFSQIGSALIANEREHARYFRCKRFRVEVNAGEAIFIPAGWWHEVFTLQPTLSVNVWFGPSPNAHLRPTLLHLKSEKYLQFMLSRLD